MLFRSRYQPAAAEYYAAHKAIGDILQNQASVDCLLENITDLETKCNIRICAYEDSELDKALEVFRGMYNAPLIADIEESTAHKIWELAGSWTGAITLAGLDLLTEKNGLAEAVEHYAAAHASTELLPEAERKKLDETAQSTLESICESARSEMRYAQLHEWQMAKDSLKQCGLRVYDVFVAIGLLLPPPKDRVRPIYTGKRAFMNRQSWRFADENVTYQRLCNEAFERNSASTQEGL